MYRTNRIFQSSDTFTGQREQSEIGLYFYGARWYDGALGRFVSPDSIIPGANNPIAWDRYAYVLNSPISYNDPSGHDPKPPSWWLPFTYDTLTFELDIFAKEVLGAEAGVSVTIDWKTIKEGISDLTFNFSDFEFSINLDLDVSIGASEEAAGLFTITGSDDSVSDQMGVNVIGADGVSLNANVCPIGCFGVGGNVTNQSQNGTNDTSSWSFGVGEGVDVSVDLLQSSDYIIYGHDQDQIDIKIPYINREFWKKIFGTEN